MSATCAVPVPFWATAFVAAQDREALTGTCVRLSGPIASLDLKLVRDPEFLNGDYTIKWLEKWLENNPAS